MKRFIPIVVVVLLLGAGIWGYLYAQGRNSSPKYRLTQVERGPLTAAVSATGNLNAVITVQVGSQVSGQIKDLMVDFNSIVKKDQVIARIDPDIFLAKVNQAKADVESARATVLNQEAQVERARADIENAKAALAESKAQTAQAPILFTIAQDLTKMQVETSVDEADIGRLKLEDRATFTVDAFPGETFAGIVTQIRKAPQVVQNVVTYTVIVGVENPSGKLMPGMTANVKLVVAQKPSALKVPNAALRFRPAGVEAPTASAPAAAGAGSGGPSAEEIRERLVKGLNLSDDQQKKLEPILQEGREQRRGLQWLPSDAERRSKAQKIREAQRARIREILTDEQKTRYDELAASAGEARSGTAGRVWVIGADGKPAAISVTLGLSDGASTEVLRGDLREGQEVIVGSAGGRGAPPQQGAPRLRL